jgi:hypothetical protein
MEFNRNKGNRQKHSIKAFTRTDEAIACMTLGQPTLSQIGGTEPRRPTIRSGTVKAYGCDFHSSYMSSSSVTGLSSPPSSAPWYSQQVINREHYYAQRQTQRNKSPTWCYQKAQRGLQTSWIAQRGLQAQWVLKESK